MEYTELQVTSNYSFLRGGSHPDELVDRAIALGHRNIGITDRNSLAGIVRGHVATKLKDFRVVVGSRLDLLDGPSLLAYPTDQAAYERLSGLLTKGNLRAEKGSCNLYKADVYEQAKGIKFVAVPPQSLNTLFDYESSFKSSLKEYREAFGNDLYVSAHRSYGGDDAKRLYRLAETGIPMVATNDVHYHELARRQLQDVLTCIREKCTIYNAGYKLHANAERYLKSPAEMQRLFQAYPDAIRRTQEIAESCTFSLDSLKYVYPEEIATDGRTPLEELELRTWEGARQRYGHFIPQKITENILYEMRFVAEMNYAEYFLTVYDVVREARKRGILCQGRGSAANSTICYCLGITSVDPTKFNLLFERFISAARAEPPDIDVDFEHERREEIMQYVYERYGRDRAAIIATVAHEWQKGAVKDAGKAMGLSQDVTEKLSECIWEYTDEWFDQAKIKAQGLNPEDAHLKKVLGITGQLMGFPRQLGQHTGGFVITRGKLSDLCPVMNATMEGRTNIVWDKNDVDAMGFLKLDLLSLGMLTCIRKAFELIKRHYNLDHELATIPHDDPRVYDMISLADTLGVFQIESRAQMSMLPRLKPRTFYDLVIEVAIVRPGPIQGDMVHPYLRRRNGEEAVVYPSKELEEILRPTLGVPLFQEQAMKIAMVAAGFSAVEADELRRAMATFKLKGLVSRFQEKLVQGMIKNGYTEEYANKVFKQLEGFGSYGFPESHAASFAQLVYVSSWIKCYYPDVFATALLNSQPMGFYQPAQIVTDAIKHGVEVRDADVNHSDWDNKLEQTDGPYHAIRLGFRQLKDVQERDISKLVAARMRPYRTLEQLCDAGVSQDTINTLSDADAFRSLGLDRRSSGWAVPALKDRPIELFEGQPSESTQEQKVDLPKMTPGEEIFWDYATIGLSLKGQPMKLVRHQLRKKKIASTEEVSQAADGTWLKVAGVITCRQRPGTAGGICFITIEDEFGFANLVVYRHLFEKYRKEIHCGTLMVEGKVQREGNVVHVVVKKCHDYTALLKGATAPQEDGQLQLAFARADERSPFPVSDKRTQTRTDAKDTDFLPKARNFR